MTDFEIYKQALSRFEESQTQLKYKKNTCNHYSVIMERGTMICTDCGEEMDKGFMGKDWNLSQNNTRFSMDPTRVQIRKIESRDISKDVENLGFSEKIISTANEIYTQVTKGKIYRGNSRKSIVFACIFHAYKLSGRPQSHEKLIKIFGLTKKISLRGLKHINLHAPKDSPVRTTYITPENLVEEIMEKFDASEQQKEEVFSLYKKIKNKSSMLNRSRPLSTAAGLVFYWICLTQKPITLKCFTESVPLSELTVNKISKEISHVLGTTGAF